MSRSGTVLTASRFLGYTRAFSIELALLTSIPIITLASCYAIYNILQSNEQVDFYFFYNFDNFYICIFFYKTFNKMGKHFSFRIFVIYRIVFGLFINSIS